MSVEPPLVASGSRQPERPGRIPKSIKQVIVLMVRGLPEDEDQRPLDFISAADVAGVAPDVCRRWLGRAEVRALLL